MNDEQKEADNTAAPADTANQPISLNPENIQIAGTGLELAIETQGKADVYPLGSQEDVPTKPIVLRPRQERFCREYIKDYNATRAYLRAYELGEETINSSAVQASGSLKNPKIATRIKQLEVDSVIKAQVDQNYVLKICTKIIEGYAESKTYKEGFGVCMGILKDYAGISGKTEVKTTNITEETRAKVRILLQQQAKIKGRRANAVQM